MTHHLGEIPSKNAPNTSATTPPSATDDASQNPRGSSCIIDLPNPFLEPASIPPAAVNSTAAASSHPEPAAAVDLSSTPGMARTPTELACGGVVVMGRPHVVGEFPSSCSLAESLPHLAAATRSVDDLGAVQDGLKMSTDGQLAGGLSAPDRERLRKDFVTAGETAPNLRDGASVRWSRSASGQPQPKAPTGGDSVERHATISPSDLLDIPDFLLRRARPAHDAIEPERVGGVILKPARNISGTGKSNA